MIRRIWNVLLAGWRIANQPSAYLSVGFLTLGGFLGGVLFWGGFNTALETTNTE
jgi:cytochrome c-type protein NapC